jgi:hypothetical protein
LRRKQILVVTAAMAAVCALQPIPERRLRGLEKTMNSH